MASSLEKAEEDRVLPTHLWSAVVGEDTHPFPVLPDGLAGAVRGG